MDYCDDFTYKVGDFNFEGEKTFVVKYKAVSYASSEPVILNILNINKCELIEQILDLSKPFSFEVMVIGKGIVQFFIRTPTWLVRPIGSELNIEIQEEKVMTHNDYRIKPELTREEITDKWVKDNDVKVGDKIGIKGKKGHYEVIEIMNDHLVVGESSVYKTRLAVDSLYVIKYQRFAFEDREMFRGEWVRLKGHKEEYLIVSIGEDFIAVCGTNRIFTYSYESLLEEAEFTDGTPFGKEVWE